jgi:hypothetical protein
MQDAAPNRSFPETQTIDVLVPYDREAGWLYTDAVGATRAEALAHFTSHGRFDLTLSEIFHLEFAEGCVHFGGGTALRSDLAPCVLPLDAEGIPVAMGIAHSLSESRRILSVIGRDPDGFDFVDAGMKMSGRCIL